MRRKAYDRNCRFDTHHRVGLPTHSSHIANNRAVNPLRWNGTAVAKPGFSNGICLFLSSGKSGCSAWQQPTLFGARRLAQFCRNEQAWKCSVSNSLIDTSSGWTLEEATAVNDNGWIVGQGYNSLTGQEDAVLLTPIPEPSTFVLLCPPRGFLRSPGGTDCLTYPHKMGILNTLGVLHNEMAFSPRQEGQR